MFNLQQFANDVSRAKPMRDSGDMKVISSVLDAGILEDISGISFERLLEVAELISGDSEMQGNLDLFSEMKSAMERIKAMPPIHRQRIL